MLQRALESFRHENYKYQNFSKYHFNVRSKPRGTKSLQVSVRRDSQLNVPGSTVFRSVLARSRCGFIGLRFTSTCTPKLMGQTFSSAKSYAFTSTCTPKLISKKLLLLLLLLITSSVSFDKSH